MGIEFIAKTTDSFQKGWARGCEELKSADLFTMDPEERRTIVVNPQTPKSFSSGEVYTVRVDGAEIRVYSPDRQLIGVSVNAPPSVLNRIAELGGETIGIVQNTREYSGLVDLAVHCGFDTLP